MRRIIIVWRLIRNRFGLASTLGNNQRPPTSDVIVFFLNLFPPYNFLCYLWVKACAAWRSDVTLCTRISRYLLRRGFLFGALRHLKPEDRSKFAEKVIVPPAVPRVGSLSSAAEAAVEELARVGFVNLGMLASSGDVEAALSYFADQSGYLAQTPLQSDGIVRQFDAKRFVAEKSSRYFCFTPSTSLACEQVVKIVKDPLLVEIARAYLNFSPYLYSVNTFATIAGDSDHYVMRLHRDYDDFRSLTFFVYWTTARADDGATLFVPRSHVSSAVDPQRAVQLAGEAGTVFALDTFGLHAGNRSVETFRVATWIRFGSIPNLATVQDGWLVPRGAGT